MSTSESPSPLYVNVILPLALEKPYTYIVPTELVDAVGFGKRVEVQFGTSKLYSGLIVEVHRNVPEGKAKAIFSVIDIIPIISIQQYDLWKWIAEYYMCSTGEVMNAALPAHLKLASETKIMLQENIDIDALSLNDNEYMIVEALSIQKVLSLDDIKVILNKKHVLPTINQMLAHDIIQIQEELKEKYKVKKAHFVQWNPDYNEQSTQKAAFELVTKSTHQTNILLSFVQLCNSYATKVNNRNIESPPESKSIPIPAKDIIEMSGATLAQLKAIAKKGILDIEELEISRVKEYQEHVNPVNTLSEKQSSAFEDIKNYFNENKPVLLHGVTGSGKTQIYIELIKEQIERNKQVLFLLPEIAITTQMIKRLKYYFGDEVIVYHSKVNNNERVDIWKSVIAHKKLILCVRSGIFLPFKDIGLIIVDEEHDASYKQSDPNPRYNARDVVLMMGNIYQAKMIMGSATPSFESYHNAIKGKYGLVKLDERFGDAVLPKIQTVSFIEAMKEKTLQSNFTKLLLDKIKATVAEKKQVILLQNKRGYAPNLLCKTCGWVALCKNCDVTMTYHKFKHMLDCHYCGYKAKVATTCPSCGSAGLHFKGFGTERLEDELQILLPDVSIGRLDLDVVRSVNSMNAVFEDLEKGKIQVLIGTQMVTKGLDFDNVTTVGIVNADFMINIPNFRAIERAYQLIVQVSGRAGRRAQQGTVMIQTYNPNHDIFRDIINNDFEGHFARAIQERKAFLFPPFVRLIAVTIKHPKNEVLLEAAILLNTLLNNKLGSKRVFGPATPLIPRINNQYIINFMIKLERDTDKLTTYKKAIKVAIDLFQHSKGMSNVRISIDVDPYS